MVLYWLVREETIWNCFLEISINSISKCIHGELFVTNRRTITVFLFVIILWFNIAFVEHNLIKLNFSYIIYKCFWCVNNFEIIWKRLLKRFHDDRIETLSKKMWYDAWHGVHSNCYISNRVGRIKSRKLHKINIVLMMVKYWKIVKCSANESTWMLYPYNIF